MKAVSRRHSMISGCRIGMLGRSRARFKHADDVTTCVAFLNAQAATLRLRHGGILKQIQIRHAGGTLPELPESGTAPAGRDRGRVDLRSAK